LTSYTEKSITVWLYSGSEEGLIISILIGFAILDIWLLFMYLEMKAIRALLEEIADYVAYHESVEEPEHGLTCEDAEEL
jgi:hypothetical protein